MLLGGRVARVALVGQGGQRVDDDGAGVLRGDHGVDLTDGDGPVGVDDRAGVLLSETLPLSSLDPLAALVAHGLQVAAVELSP